MNILIPHTWLLEHLETEATPEKIQECLSLCGPSVERIYEREGEAVYDIEVTTNRIDSMSVRGIAREAAVILRQFGIAAQLKQVPAQKLAEPDKNTALPLPKITNDPKYCSRVICVVLRDVDRTQTPDWMAKRLRQIEVNVHDSVIDITNYITHELGHPCHAFDYDAVMATGGSITVTEAAPGMPFTTLDGESYKTIGGEIVFVNDAGDVIDLPAIKGTANTSINPETRNVLLWIETLDAKKVRFASMSHAIRTVAAQLSEKQVDPHLAEPVLLRGVELYQDLCHAQVASPLFDEFPGKKTLKPVTVTHQRITEYLGLEVPATTIIDILTDLECKVIIKENTLATSFGVTPPTFRKDLEIPADIIEEIARIYGYYKLPSVIMATPIPLEKPVDVDFHLENQIKHFLAASGWQELYTFSMVSPELAVASGCTLEDHLALNNPLTDDHVYLRRSLVPSLAEVFAHNPQRSKLSVFEIANVYHPQKDNLPAQELHLTLVSNLPYREVRGEVENLLRQFFVHSLRVEVTNDAASQGGQSVGELVVLSDEKLTTLGTVTTLAGDLTAFDIHLDALRSVAKKHPKYQPLSKTSSILEDLTFTIPQVSGIGEVLTSIETLSPLVKTVALKTIYQQNYTFTIEYWDAARNLATSDIEPLRKSIITAVQNEYGAQLVGTA